MSDPNNTNLVVTRFPSIREQKKRPIFIRWPVIERSRIELQEVCPGSTDGASSGRQLSAIVGYYLRFRFSRLSRLDVNLTPAPNLKWY